MIIDAVPIDMLAILFFGIVGLFLFISALRMPKKYAEFTKKRDEIRRLKARTDLEGPSGPGLT